ncbi:hypothetical protein F4604DRAFT_1772731 [Suillus subluteus]|nr:hypothetical protein F4604DRAFT_1772731 [Suillus subluteus]
MTPPGLGRAIGFVADVLVLPSHILAAEQQPKPEPKSLNQGDCKGTKEIYTCLSCTAATSTTRGRLGRCGSLISSLV